MTPGKKIKVLFIHHGTGWGGAPNSMIQLINALDKSAFEVKVLLLRDSIVSQKLKENDIKFSIAHSIFYKKFYQFTPHTEAGYVRWFQVIRFFKLLIIWTLNRFYFANKELSRYHYDIVHLNSSVLTDWLAPASFNAKVVIHIREPFRHGLFDILNKFFLWQIKKYANHIIAISKDNAIRIGLLEKTTIIYNPFKSNSKPIDTNSYSSKKVLYLGGDAKIKGFHILVEALQYLNDDIKVYFGGHYNLKKKLGHHWLNIFLNPILPLFSYKNKMIKKMRINSKAEEIGLIKNIEDVLQSVCCLVAPSTTPHFLRPVIESFANHKSVIVSDVDGMTEIVINNYNGIIVKKCAAKELARAINQITHNPEFSKELGENGYTSFIKSYNINYGKMVQDIYLKMLNDSRSQSKNKVN